MEESVNPYCPGCGDYTRSGVYCEDCLSEDQEPIVDEEICMCGLSAEEHTYPTVDHNFIPKRKAVFTHCNVCGRKLNDPEEDEIGMCRECGNL